jgi:hypothetical protein
MLYTISGVPREYFSRFPMPRNTEVFAPTFAEQGIVRDSHASILQFITNSLMTAYELFVVFSIFPAP